MSDYPSCITINDLSETSFIAGTYYEITFDVYNSGSAVDITSGSTSWKMARFGDPDTAILSKSGSASGSPVNRFVIALDSADTVGLSGKYIHQPKVVDYTGQTYYPSQGVLTLKAAIP